MSPRPARIRGFVPWELLLPLLVILALLAFSNSGRHQLNGCSSNPYSGHVVVACWPVDK